MHLSDYVSILRKRWLYVVAPVLISVAVSLGLSFSAVPEYQSTASVYFALPYGNTANDLVQGSNFAQQQLSSYATLATLPVVLEPVIKRLDLVEGDEESGFVPTSARTLAGAITATASVDSVIIDITATNSSPAAAAQIANAVATELGVVVNQLSPRNDSGNSQIDVSTVATATAPSSPSSPKTKRDLGVAALAGLFLGLLLAYARDRLDTRVRGLADLADVTALGTIPFEKAAGSSPLIIKNRSRSVRAEAVRQVRTNLQFADVDHPLQMFVVTSSVAAEGKSSTATNLALVFADAGRNVLLVEADLRRPKVSDYLGLERAVGLTNVLAGQVELDHAFQVWTAGNLTVLPSGSTPPNPSELLGSHNMIELLAALRQRFDIVIIDTPPLLPVTDAAVLAARTDGAVVVVGYGKVTRKQTASAIESLRSVDARVLGVVLNRAPMRGADAVPAYGYESYTDEHPETPTLDNTLAPRRPGAVAPPDSESIDAGTQLYRHRTDVGAAREDASRTSADAERPESDGGQSEENSSQTSDDIAGPETVGSQVGAVGRGQDSRDHIGMTSADATQKRPVPRRNTKADRRQRPRSTQRNTG